jgi:hypothetical protein
LAISLTSRDLLRPEALMKVDRSRARLVAQRYKYPSSLAVCTAIVKHACAAS